MLKKRNFKIWCRILCVCMLFSGAISCYSERTFAAGVWVYDGVTVDKAFLQEASDLSVNVKAGVSGTTSGLRYKFVWMKNNWAQWGIIRDFSEANSVNWTPGEVGEYTIYADVKDSLDKIITKTASCTVWKSEGATFVQGNSVKSGAAVDINAKLSSPQVSGNLQYKFVWMKDDWDKWGVIKDFSQSASVRWTPSEIGRYKICVDVKDGSGKISTGISDLEVHQDWDYQMLKSSESAPKIIGSTISFSTEITGDTKNLRYKFVWMKNNWAQWGIIRDFSEANSVNWTPGEVGEYTIYADVKDSLDRTITKTVPCVIWKSEGATFVQGSQVMPNTTVDINAKLSSSQVPRNLQYKFVWMKDNWSKWGVIKDFSQSASVSWKTPVVPGFYKIYVDVRDDKGNVSTGVSDLKNGSYRANINLVESIMTKNPCYTEGRKITVKGLMLHSVGCPQPSAKAFVDSWNSSSFDAACVHGFIDALNGTVYQTLPWNHRGWHCGRGHAGSGNDFLIGVEMCEPSCINYTHGSSFTCSDRTTARACVERTYNSAVELFAMLCNEFGLDPMADGVIVSHREGHSRGIASNHGDPEHIWTGLGMGYDMNTFRQAVRSRMNRW